MQYGFSFCNNPCNKNPYNYCSPTNPCAQCPPGPQGIAGPQGPQGLPGPAGPIGPIGPAGIQGVPGIQGSIGPQGLPGPAGVQGAQGNQGETGPQGEAGPRGSTGSTGPTGLQGEPGIQGATGPQGMMSPASAPGVYVRMGVGQTAPPEGSFFYANYLASPNFQHLNATDLTALVAGTYFVGYYVLASITSGVSTIGLAVNGVALPESAVSLLPNATGPLVGMFVVMLGVNDSITLKNMGSNNLSTPSGDYTTVRITVFRIE